MNKDVEIHSLPKIKLMSWVSRVRRISRSGFDSAESKSNGLQRFDSVPQVEGFRYFQTTGEIPTDF